MRVSAIINERAGSALGRDLPAIEAAIREPFEAEGHQVKIVFSSPKNLAAAIDAAAKDDVDAIVVGGGDGTVRCGARAAIASGKTLGILPLGTLNRMARDLGIPLEPGAAAAALAAAETAKIDVASVNGSIYLCNSLIGLPPVYSAERQRLRGRPLRERLVGYAQVIKAILSSSKRFHVTLDHGGEQKPIRVLSMAIANNAYCEQPGIGLTRPALDGGELAVYASRHRSGWAMARALIRAIFGRWSGDPHLEQFRGRDITIRTGRKHLQVSNDGELETLATPLKYKSHPKALNVLLPPRPA